MQFTAKDVKAALDLFKEHGRRYNWPADTDNTVWDLGDMLEGYGAAPKSYADVTLPSYGDGGYELMYYWGVGSYNDEHTDIDSGPLCGSCASETIRQELKDIASPDFDPEYFDLTTFFIESSDSYDGADGGRYCEGCNEMLIEPAQNVTYTTDDDFNETFICIGDERRGPDEQYQWFTMSEIAERWGETAVMLMHEYHSWSGFKRDEQTKYLAKIAAETDRQAKIDAGQLGFTGVYENIFTGQLYR